jgi:hypothetical protein
MIYIGVTTRWEVIFEFLLKEVFGDVKLVLVPSPSIATYTAQQNSCCA